MTEYKWIECPHCGEIGLPASGGECEVCGMETNLEREDD